MLNDIARFRRFARAVTTEVGALDESFLGLGRPLGAARVLNAIGHGRSEVSALRDYLRLDSGLLSRLLRGLEEEGLIETTPGDGDQRRRMSRLTKAGETAFAAYERLSDARASAFLSANPRAPALLAAMDLIATAFALKDVRITEADPRSEAGRHCLAAYYAELGRRFPGGFDVNLSRDPDASSMIRPRGVFLLAWADTMPIGCGGLKGGGRVAGSGEPFGEVKRMWIAPEARGFGLAQRMLGCFEEAARTLDLTLLRLDSNSALPEAIALYRKCGWVETQRFNDDPYPDHFFEKRIG
jgi:DNA-binding MarR family transcriptional regulator